MGWAKDAFENELAHSGILPMNHCSNSYSGYSYNKPKKKELCYYEYDFPTEAQTRALRFITMHTGIIYKGKSRKEAKVFINENIEYAREMANE